MLRVIKNRCRITALNDLAFAHDNYLIGDFGDHTKIMGDKHHRHATLFAQIENKLQDLCLCRDIKGGCRLIGDQEFGLQRQCHGDHRTLALPT